MKKLLIFSMMMLTSLFATEMSARDRAVISDYEPVTLKKGNFQPGETIGYMNVEGQVYTVVAPPKKTDTRADDNGDGSTLTEMPITPVIYNAPGTVKRYTKDVEAAYYMGTPLRGLYGMASSINIDGNDFYFKNIITSAPGIDSFVKGSLSGNKVTVPLNQTIKEFEEDEFEEGEEPYAVNFGLLRPVFTLKDDGSINIWYEFSNDYDSVDYIVGPDGSMELQFQPAKYDTSFPGSAVNPYETIPPYAIGCYYNNDLEWTGWTGHCDLFQIYFPFDYEEVVVPSGLSWNYFVYKTADNLGVIVQVAETEDAVYIKGLSAYLPDLTFKADKLVNGNLSVAPGQFIGLEMGVYFVITDTGYFQNNQIEQAPEGTPAIFVVERDDTGKILSISADPNSQYFLVFNDDPEYFFDFDSFYGITLESHDSFEGTPCNPTDLQYGPYQDEMGANYIFFKLSSLSNTGDVLMVDKLYYSIFVNGDPVEFEQQIAYNLMDKEIVMYSGMTTPSMLVPYSFYNDIDLYEDNGGTFIVGLYIEGIETVGVEAVYTGGSEPTYSDLVTIDVQTGNVTILPGSDAKVESIHSDDVVSVEYYDLQGRKVSAPSKGLYVKKYTLSDGSVKSNKVIVY